MNPTTADLDNVALLLWGPGVTYAALSPYLQQWAMFTAQTLLYAQITPAAATVDEVNAAYTYLAPFIVQTNVGPGKVVLSISDQTAWSSGAGQAIQGSPLYVPTSPSGGPCDPTAPGSCLPPSTPPPPSSPPPSSPPPVAPPIAAPVFKYTYGPGSYCADFPSDPFCLSLAEDNIGATVIVLNEPSSTVFDGVNITVTGVQGADVTGAVDNVVAKAVNAIQQVLTDIGNALKAAWNILGYLSGLILTFLQHLLTEIVQSIVKALLEIRTLLGDLYKNVLLPLAQAALKIRKALLDVYQRFIRPMVIVIQDLRQVLSILAAFHVSFARKLDQKLADLESRITRPFLYVLSFVNAVSNWVNLIVTAGYLLQKSVFLNSLLAYVGEALNLQLNAMNQPASAAGVAAANAANTVPTAAQASGDLRQFLGSDTGSMPAGLQNYVNQFTTNTAAGQL